MQCLHLDLVIVDLLSYPSQLVPYISPLFLYLSLLISLFLCIFMQYFLQMKNLVLLCFSFKYDILLKFLLINLF